MTNISESAPTKACRTCLAKICSNGNPLYSETTESTRLRKRLEAVLPEINLCSIPDSAVCSDCCTAINSFYHFKQRCLEIENNIQDLLPSLTGDGDTESNHRPSESDSPHQTNTRVKLERETDVNSASLGHFCGGVKNECPDPEEASPALPNAGEDSEAQKDSGSPSKEQEETLQQLSQLELVDIFSVEFNTDVMKICDGADAEDCVVKNNEKSQVNKKGANRRGGKRVKQTYICHDCGYSAAYKSELVKHVSKHRSQQGKSNTPNRTSFKKLVSQLKDDATFSLHKCAQCHYTCKSKATLKSHTINHNKEKLYKCDKCDFRTAYSNYIGIRKKLHSEERPLKCPKCDYRCVQTQNLKLHLANHTGEKKYKCDKCNFQTQYQCGFDIHMRIHSGVKSFNCKICDYSCITKRMLDNHLKIHTGDKPYKCKFCEHRTTQLSHLKIHLRTHTGEKPYKCNVCDYCTVSKTALRQHSNIHLEDKPFKCSKCDYRTTQRSHLKIHLRQHTGEKPYQCGTCPYKASSGSMLRLHMRTHTGEKPYKCSECDYASTQISPLKVHMKRHSKLKNPSFKCDSCDFATVHKNVLKRHMKTH